MSVSLNLLSSIKKHDVDKMVSTIDESVNILQPDLKANITLTICDNEYIKMLNSKYRKIFEPTDVLSFPMVESIKPGEIVYSPVDIDPDKKELLLGDIIISLEKAKEQAIEYGHSLERELCYLAIHSVLHLVGYDHMNESDKTLMRNKEEEILEILKIMR